MDDRTQAVSAAPLLDSWRDQLRHFSLAQHIVPVATEQPASNSSYAKPDGLWVSVEGGEDVWGWSDWTASESFGIGPWMHAVTLADDADLLVIPNASELGDFDRAYRRDLGDRWSGIDWHRVANDYQGIVITPYLWSMRLHIDCGWYYTWDCASGCIWDPAAIASVELIGATPGSEVVA